MRSTALSPKRALWKFGFKQTIRGAIIVGLISAFMLALQGVAYQKSYPDAASRTKFAASLSATPSLGFIYGEPKNLDVGTAGYMVYRVVGFMGVITAVWSLMATTRLLRGSEEDGRWEIIRVGAVPARTATKQVMLGFSLAWLLACVLSTLLTLLVTKGSKIDISLYATLLLNLAIFLPGLLFAGVGLLTSQLAVTRQRALVYGLVPIVVLFLVRGIANVETGAHWLLTLTPFGWAELISPVLHPQAWWLLGFIVLGALCASIGLYLAQRDLGSSIFKQSGTARSHYALLGSSWQLGLRQNAWIFAGWALGAFVLIGLIAALTTTAINATGDSGSLSRSIHALASNSADLKIAFLGAGMVFLVMVLLLMAINLIGSIRRDEAKQYLDTILVQPQRRTSWLARRLLLGFSVTLVISLLCGVILYAISSSQTISLGFGTVIATSVCLVGSVGFLLGLGALLYGLAPRIVTIVLYAVIGWSFLITLLASAVKLNTVILHSSLFQYTSFNLAQSPDWKTFGVMLVLGVVMAILGITAFQKRDIIAD